MNEITTFKVGDVVSWKSQSAGYVKVKTGDVLEVVGVRSDPSQYKVTKSGGFILPNGGFGNPRNHESYLIRVEQGGDAKPKLYWPVVSCLRLEKRASGNGSDPKESADAELPGDLPGIPAPTGPLAHATREFVKRRQEIEEAKAKLKTAGNSIMEAMIKEGKASIALETHGERYKFTVMTASSRLHMTKMKNKDSEL